MNVPFTSGLHGLLRARLTLMLWTNRKLNKNMWNSYLQTLRNMLHKTVIPERNKVNSAITPDFCLRVHSRPQSREGTPSKAWWLHIVEATETSSQRLKWLKSPSAEEKGAMQKQNLGNLHRGLQSLLDTKTLKHRVNLSTGSGRELIQSWSI